MHPVFRTLSHNAPKCTEFWHYFSILQYKKKHVQGWPLVVVHVVAPLTTEHQELKEKKIKIKEAGVSKLASRKPVHQADL